MKRALLTMAIAAATAGCGSDYEITEQNLQGTIGGTAWVFVEGDTNDFLSDNTFFASLYPAGIDVCGFNASQDPHLILNIPMEVGEWELSLSLNMTFVIDTPNGTDNLIATEGLLRVDSITNDTVTGGIHARYDGDNEVDGTFSVTICPP